MVRNFNLSPVCLGYRFVGRKRAELLGARVLSQTSRLGLKTASTALTRRIAKGVLSPQIIERVARAMPVGQVRQIKRPQVLGLPDGSSGKFNLVDTVVGNWGPERYAGLAVRKLPLRDVEGGPAGYYAGMKPLIASLNRKFNSRSKLRGNSTNNRNMIAEVIDTGDRGLFQRLATKQVTPATTETGQHITRNVIGDLHSDNIGPKGQVLDFSMRNSPNLPRAAVTEQSSNYLSPAARTADMWDLEQLKIDPNAIRRHWLSGKPMPLPDTLRIGNESVPRGELLNRWLKTRHRLDNHSQSHSRLMGRMNTTLADIQGLAERRVPWKTRLQRTQSRSQYLEAIAAKIRTNAALSSKLQNEGGYMEHLLRLMKVKPTQVPMKTAANPSYWGGHLSELVKQSAFIKQSDLLAARDRALIAAGLAVQARDTGRVLLIQRAFDKKDPAGGMWETPGGHIDDGESPLDGAIREFEEETGFKLPSGSLQAVWNYGIYRGHVWSIARESMLDLRQPQGTGDRKVLNPDNPEQDYFEAIAWWKPELMIGNPSLRQELRASMHLVQRALDRDRHLRDKYAGRLAALQARRDPDEAKKVASFKTLLKLGKQLRTRQLNHTIKQVGEQGQKQVQKASGGLIRTEPVFQSELVRNLAKVVPGEASRRTFLKLHASPFMAGSTMGTARALANTYQYAGANPTAAVVGGLIAGRTAKRRFAIPGHKSLLRGGLLSGSTGGLAAGLNYLVGEPAPDGAPNYLQYVRERVKSIWPERLIMSGMGVSNPKQGGLAKLLKPIVTLGSGSRSFVKNTLRPGVGQLKKSLQDVSKETVALPYGMNGGYRPSDNRILVSSSLASNGFTTRPENTALVKRLLRHESIHALQHVKPLKNSLQGFISRLLYTPEGLPVRKDSWRRALGTYLAEVQAHAAEAKSVPGQFYNGAKFMANPLAALAYGLDSGPRYAVIHGASALPTIATPMVAAGAGGKYLWDSAMGQKQAGVGSLVRKLVYRLRPPIKSAAGLRVTKAVNPVNPYAPPAMQPVRKKQLSADQVINRVIATGVGIPIGATALMGGLMTDTGARYFAKGYKWLNPAWNGESSLHPEFQRDPNINDYYPNYPPDNRLPSGKQSAGPSWLNTVYLDRR